MRSITTILRRVWIGAAVAAALALSLSVSGAAQQPRQVRGVAGPGQAPAYLALGDSYPYGADGSGALPKNDNVFVGYPDYLSEILDRPLVNTGCPGETTGSFLTGDPALGGPFCALAKEAGLLHVDYTGGQMAFVEDYLATHDRVVLVTLQLGGNDLQFFAAQCHNNPACIMAGFPGFLATLAGNFDAMLGRIRSAGYAGPIIVVEYPATNYNNVGAQLQSVIYQTLRPVVQAHGGDMAPVFERFRVAALPYGGDSCAAGLLITNADGTCNIHPTDAGHQVIASVIAEMPTIDPSSAQ